MTNKLKTGDNIFFENYNKLDKNIKKENNEEIPEMGKGEFAKLDFLL